MANGGTWTIGILIQKEIGAFLTQSNDISFDALFKIIEHRNHITAVVRIAFWRGNGVL